MSQRFSARLQRGLSLIELIVFIVIVSVALVGVLSVLNVSVKSSADPVIRKQALAVAEAMLEEVLSKDYQNVMTTDDDPGGVNADTPSKGCTPSTATKCRSNTVGDRQNYNDVNDYNGWNQAGVYDLLGALVPIPGTYAVKIAVAPQTLSGVAGKMVTVSVAGGAETVVLSGFRANF